MATPKRTCTVEHCDKAHAARGFCKTHYNQQMPNRHRKHDVTCDWCGTVAQKYTKHSRYARTFCGTTCRDHALSGHAGVSVLPKDHWAFWYGTTSQWTPPVILPAFQVGTCNECAKVFTEAYCPTPSDYCGMTCARRSSRRRRRAREYNAPGHFTYNQLARQYLKQGSVCAYCKSPCIGMPDPEHVLPLSRGGRNDMSNVVAACRPCNADKNDLTLTEWAADRERRGLPAVDITLSGPAYTQVWQTAPLTVAWRDRQPA